MKEPLGRQALGRSGRPERPVGKTLQEPAERPFRQVYELSIPSWSSIGNRSSKIGRSSTRAALFFSMLIAGVYPSIFDVAMVPRGGSESYFGRRRSSTRFTCVDQLLWLALSPLLCMASAGRSKQKTIHRRSVSSPLACEDASDEPQIGCWVFLAKLAQCLLAVASVDRK